MFYLPPPKKKPIFCNTVLAGCLVNIDFTSSKIGFAQEKIVVLVLVVALVLVAHNLIIHQQLHLH